MTEIKFDDVVDGGYYLCYYYRRKLNIRAMFIFKMSEVDNNLLTSYNDQRRILVFEQNVYSAHLRTREQNVYNVKIGNEHPFLIVMENMTELFKLTEDEIKQHVMLETI